MICERLGVAVMYRTTGSKRISVIIQDKKGRYLVAERMEMGEAYLEFPGFLSEDARLSNDESGLAFVANGIKEILGVEIKEATLIETFYDDEYPFYHYIYRVSTCSGNPQKGYYTGIHWKRLNEIDVDKMNVLSLQVYQKITECTYCLKICNKKSEIDKFIQAYMNHDVGRMVSEILESLAGDNDDVYRMAIRYYFVHLRAWLVEKEDSKKNRTIQNFLRLYDRQDLLQEVEDVLSLEIGENWKLKSIIKDFVDKNIAHYDELKEETEEIVAFCEKVFSKHGVFPLQDFVPYMESYMMSLVIECWYYAGELGDMISDTKPELGFYMGINRQGILQKMHEKLRNGVDAL